MTTYTIEEIRMAAYNWVELPDMSERDRALWVGLGYCYEWYRARPNEKKECEALADVYIRLFRGEEVKRNG